MIKHSEEFKQEAVRIAHCAEQRVAALAGRVGFGDWQVDAEQMGFTLSSI
jgi:transposase-like protein